MMEEEETTRNTTSFFYLIITLMHLTAIILFTRGFLLTRTELPFHSECSDVVHSPCFHNHTSPPPPPQQQQQQEEEKQNHKCCWGRPVVDRLIVIVLDALRFDFVAPSSFFPEKKAWMDRLTVLQKKAAASSSSARIFKAIADPPTTSLQRLKGLTTGGLPTFIDVGNSFGAPAIVEDNFIHQLVSNGKRVIMMGDDTWTQLFPNHFNKSYPYPSFNVKDLHTVDNGCIENLFPSLYHDDWDVLIAHFLGVDHAGHIFGVDSAPMIEKLDQYNIMLENVINVLESQSGVGGLHENTFLLVMGDHGQTLNGDHGGGSAEEVETSMFAMNFKKHQASIPSELDSSSCETDWDCKRVRISSIQQLDFAVTVSALLDIPFPFGSIGRVNPELYALASGVWYQNDMNLGNHKNELTLEQWAKDYVNLLCINAWQVKRYTDVYSASSVIGFSSEDLSHIADIYSLAEGNWSHVTKKMLRDNDSGNSLLPTLMRQIEAYSDFLSNVSELARSKWTEFNLTMMGIGLGVILISLIVMFLASQRMRASAVFVFSWGSCGISFELIVSFFIAAIRACSFLSNSYILEEGKVANFLLATTAIFKLRHSAMTMKMLSEALIFLMLVSILRFSIEVGLSKQAATSSFLHASSSWMLGFSPGYTLWTYVEEIAPILALILLSYLLYRTMVNTSERGNWKLIIIVTISSYMLIALHWVSESKMLSSVFSLQEMKKNYIPRIIYSGGICQLLLVAFSRMFYDKEAVGFKQSLVMKTVAIISAWSPTIIILSGKQGSLVALASVIGGYCIIRLERSEETSNETSRVLPVELLSVTQWNLFAVCLFFATGHWCAFDGLRYGAAFIGFDDFALVRQAILLAIETFGFSHILPLFGLPFLAISSRSQQPEHENYHIFARLSQMYIMYGLIITTTVMASIICVTIQRRHLMVWGLFAPKFVFDVVGLILTDIVICLASVYYTG